jgi:predicted secreted protein with PEFG-CTERM motif
MISEYWLANMRASSIVGATLVAIMVIFGSSAMILIPTQVGATNAANCPQGICPVASDSITNVSINPASGSSPLLVTFGVTVSTTSSVKDVIWGFGDGQTTSGNYTKITHTYGAGGNYTGAVEVDFTDGQDDHQAFSISVSGLGAGVAALNSTVPNPNAGTMNAYQLLLQEHNNTLTSTTQPQLSVATNSPTYGQGDSIVIHGAVRDMSNSTDVTMEITNPVKNLVSILEITPASDGSFSKTVLATGPLWTTAGNYTVKAQYGPAMNATTSFYFNGGNGQSIINVLVNGTYSMQAGQLMFNIPYTIQGGTVQSMQAIPSQSSVVITISSTADGSLTVDLPRALIDAKQQPPVSSAQNNTMTTQYNQAELPDQPFIVQINGQNVKATQTASSAIRTLGIPFHKGDTTIYVIGTIAVPEFGPIAALVLAIAIVSIIAVSAKTGLRFMPRSYGPS